jgi:PAS domain S-box-containing protein
MSIHYTVNIDLRLHTMKIPFISTTDSSILAVLNDLAGVFSADLEPQELMAVAAREFRKIFNADRVWLVCPCDPNSTEEQVCYEATIQDNSDMFSGKDGLKVSRGVAGLFRDALASDDPIIQIQGTEKLYDPDMMDRYSIRSMMSIALKMKNDRPWLLELHQCDHKRVWTETEVALFRYAGKRLCEVYNNLSILNSIKKDTVIKQKMEVRLVRSEQRFRSFFHFSSVALFLVDISELINFFEELRASGVTDLNKYFAEYPRFLAKTWKNLPIVDVNNATLRLFETSDKKRLTSRVNRLYTRKTADAARSVCLALFSGLKHVSLQTESKTFKRNHLDAIINIDILPGDDFLALVSITDISPQKMLEATLHESREQYKKLIETANDAILIADAETGLILQANRKAEVLTGYSKAELIGMHQSRLRSANERRSADDLFKRHSRKGMKDRRNISEIYLLHAEGEQIPVEISSSSITVGGRKVVQGIFRDLRTRYEGEELRRLLATVTEQTDDSVMITDTEHRIIFINPAFERVSGYHLEDIAGKTPRFLRSGKHDKSFYRMIRDTLSERHTWHGHFINRRKDGTLYEEDAIITPVTDHTGKVINYVAVKRDITNQISLEKQVRQAQKMQAIGTLAGGIAHDFNNILTAIMGFAELSLLYCKDNPTLENNIQEVIRGADRAGKLIEQILTFSRQTEKNVAALRLSIVIKEALKLLRATLPANIEIIQDLNTEVMVRADPTQIIQVIMNLCTNAYQSITADKGWIKVSMKSVVMAAREGVEIGNLSPGKYVCITVEDNGCGISTEYLGRIFEPYFTTSEKDEGTGLGLSVVHGIVNDHGGAVTVDTETGQGSCFTVYLPEISSQENYESKRRQELPTGEGRVLVVDDERQIVDYEIQILQRTGYTTKGFLSSLAALEALRADPDGYDLVITDMAMPDMTGLQLFTEIRKIRSNIPVLLCTGYSEHVTAESSRSMGINGYLAKPFTAEQFAVEVKRVIADGVLST